MKVVNKNSSGRAMILPLNLRHDGYRNYRGSDTELSQHGRFVIGPEFWLHIPCTFSQVRQISAEEMRLEAGRDCDWTAVYVGSVTHLGSSRARLRFASMETNRRSILLEYLLAAFDHPPSELKKIARLYRDANPTVAVGDNDLARLVQLLLENRGGIQDEFTF